MLKTRQIKIPQKNFKNQIKLMQNFSNFYENMKNESKRWIFLIFWGSFGAIRSSSPKTQFLTKNG